MVIFSALFAAAAAPAATPVTGRAPIVPRDLVEVAEITGPTRSPDGRRVAFRVSRPSIKHNDTVLDWYVVDLDGGPPRRIGSGGTARHEGSGGLAEEAPVWDRDSLGLRFLARAEGAIGIWHWRDGEPARLEIVDDADIRSFALSADGDALRYTVGATRADIAAEEHRAYDDGILVDERLDVNQPLAGGVIDDGRRVMQRLPGRWFERSRLLADTPVRQKIVRLDGQLAGRAPAFLPKKPAQGEKVEAATGDVAEIQRQHGKTALIVTRSGGASITCTAAVCHSQNLAALAWRPGRDELLLFEGAGSARETVWLWVPGERRTRKLTTTDGRLRTPGEAPRCAVGPENLVCVESRPLVPPRLVRINYSGEREILADPNAALAGRVAAKAIPLAFSRGITGILLTPLNGSGPFPTVVQYYHCDGFLKGGVGDEIPMLPLIEHGIAILCLDRIYAPKSAGMGASYERALDSISEAIDGLAARRLIDPRRIGIGGLSFGSEVALWAVRKSRRFAAATLSSGTLSSFYYWSNALPARGFAEMLSDYWKIGDPDSDSLKWKTLSAADDVSRLDTPLLLQLPESEVRTSIELHTRLKRAGKPVDLYVFADEPHIKYQPRHKLAVYRRNLDWYRFWLKDQEDADPGKAVQYARWRAYRAGQSLPVPAP